MCLSNESELTASGFSSTESSYVEAMTVLAYAPGVPVFTDVQWAELQAAALIPDGSLYAAPVPNGPIELDIDPADLAELRRLFGSGSYVPGY